MLTTKARVLGTVDLIMLQLTLNIRYHIANFQWDDLGEKSSLSIPIAAAGYQEEKVHKNSSNSMLIRR